MSRILPPLTAVRAFEAAARHLSFTRAGEELGMTQAAVSYQVKVLEDRIGAPLFLRRPRGVALTALGREFASVSGEALDLLSASFAAARNEGGGELAVDSNPTFASNWLVPRIASLHAAHPEIALRLSTSLNLVDFAREEIDVALRAGRGGWPGLAQHKLIEVTFTPMLSPTLIERLGMPEKPADLLSMPLLDRGDSWWESWFAAAGVKPPDRSSGPTNDLGSQHLVARAAIGGQGVAILTPDFYRDEIALGLLIQPFQLVENLGHAHWLVYPEARRNVPKIRAFREWLLKEAAGSTSG